MEHINSSIRTGGFSFCRDRQVGTEITSSNLDKKNRGEHTQIAKCYQVLCERK